MTLLEGHAELNETERKTALDDSCAIIRNNVETFTYRCQNHSSVNNYYPARDNDEWTTGFWPGELWLAYEHTGDELFSHVAQIHVESFYHRIVNKIAVDHHDMGFLYTPSCTAAWKLVGDRRGREAALMAADQLCTRYQGVGRFIQAWGPMGVRENYRYIIDCLLNLPLLYWASEEMEDNYYRTIALAHTETTLKYSFRDDYSCHHTFFMDPVTGVGVRGETNQGHDSKSSWARGQAWAIYGLALSFQKTGDRTLLDLFEPVSEYFLSRLPADLVPYWDLIFTEGDEPRDSSSASIVACGFLAAAESFDELGEAEKAGMYRSLAKKLLKALYVHCRVLPGDDSNGLIYHGTYCKKTPFNTCTEAGVDECVSWGDYYWMEALTRLGGGWEPYW